MARRKNYINRIHIMIEFAALAVWLASMILAILGCHHFNPGVWKLPFNVNPDRLDLVYTDITYLILILELLISIICLWMTVAGFRQGNVGIGFPIFAAVSISLDIIVWTVLAVRHNGITGCEKVRNDPLL